MKQLTSILILIIYSLSANSQIRGVINNREGRPVDFATVSLLSPADSSIVKYSISDREGKFTLEHNLRGEYIIQIRNLSYQTKDTVITLPITLPLIFTLEESVVTLDDVVVQGTSRGVRWSADTLKYDIKKFSDGNEQVLSELLNKLPGVDVDSKGVTKVQGKVVDKFLVNGSDVFGSNAQLAVKNISADMVDNVEVVNNYSEYSILGGFRSYDKTAINIGIDKSKANGIMGDILLSGGYNDKYLSRANLMRIKGKSMLSFIGSYNNIGEEVFSIEEYLKLQGGIGDILSNGTASLSLSSAQTAMLMPQKDVFRSQAGVASLNWAYNPSSKLRINSSLLSNFNRSDALSQSIYTYYLSQGRTYESQNISERKFGNTLNSAFVSVEYSPTESFLVNYKLNTTLSDYSQNETSLLDKIHNNSENRSHTFGLNQNLTLIKRFNENLLTTQITHSFNRANSTYDYLTDSILIPVPYIKVDSLFRVRQQGSYLRQNLNADISYLHRLSSDIFIQTSLKGSSFWQTFDNHIDGNDKYLSDRIFRHYSLGVELVRNRGLVQFRVGGILYFVNRETLLFPKADFTLFMSNRHNLKLSYNQSITPISLENLAATTLIDNYQSYYGGTLIDKDYSLRHNFSMLYRLFSGYSGTLFYVNSGYFLDQNSTTSSYKTNGTTSERLSILSPLKRGVYARMGLNQRLASTLNIKTNISWDFNELHNEINTLWNTTHSNRTKARIELLSTFQSAFNFEIGALGEYLLFFNRSGNIEQQTLGIFGKVKFSPSERLYFDVSGQYTQSRAITNQNLTDLGFVARYEVIKSKLEVEILGQNILNLNKLEWNRITNNGLYSVNEYYMQIPGNIRLAVKYKL